MAGEGNSNKRDATGESVKDLGENSVFVPTALEQIDINQKSEKSLLTNR